MAASALRLLVVDDFEPWRRFVRTTIQTIPDVVIVGEASDGPEAIEKAGKLRPDLVLLDIGLPLMNGIEVAQEIGKVSPESKIVFMSQGQSSDVIEECFRAGASGYVVKSSAANDLIPAINAALNVRLPEKQASRVASTFFITASDQPCPCSSASGPSITGPQA